MPCLRAARSSRIPPATTLLSFTDEPVTNNSTVANTTPPVLRERGGVVSRATRLTLTFNEDLDITET